MSLHSLQRSRVLKNLIKDQRYRSRLARTAVSDTGGLLLEGREFRAGCRHYRGVIGLDVVPLWPCSFSSSTVMLLMLRRRGGEKGHGMGRAAHTFVVEWAAWKPRWSDCAMVIAALLLAENGTGPTTCQAIETSCMSQIAAGLARIWPSRCRRWGPLPHLKPRPPICDQR